MLSRNKFVSLGPSNTPEKNDIIMAELLNLELAWNSTLYHSLYPVSRARVINGRVFITGEEEKIITLSENEKDVFKTDEFKDSLFKTSRTGEFVPVRYTDIRNNIVAFATEDSGPREEGKSTTIFVTNESSESIHTEAYVSEDSSVKQ